jgi:hypothetical protein
MATLAPPGNVKAKFVTSNTNSEQLATALRPWHRRLALQQALSWTGRGIISGLILACLLLLVSRLTPWVTAPRWAIGIGIACSLFAFSAAIWYRPSLARVARLVDARLSLQDRMSTAWEMRKETAPLYALQRDDALKQLSQHVPSAAISVRPRRSSMVTSGIVVVAIALLVLLPNPMTTVLQQQAAFQVRIAKQIVAIEHLRTSLAQLTNTSPQQRAQIDQILRDLETKLQNAHNETEAQQAIAEAQARLNQLRDPQANNQAQAHANASSSLESSSNASLSAVGQALATNDSKRLSNALQNLTSQVSHMTPAQRAQLAQQIENAANQANQNPKLRAALHQLAKAIADGSPSEIADATNALEIAASQDATAQAQANSIDQATQRLQQAANTLASATDGTNSQGQNQNQGQGQNGQGQGQQGQGQRQGQGNGQDQVQGSGSGNGSGGRGNHTGSKSGQNEQVFVPGQIGSGSSAQSNNGNNSVVQNGSSVPYSQVIERYKQMAHDAIDNSDISPDRKDLVHGYFNSLEGQ